MNSGAQAIVSTKSGKLEGIFKDGLYIFRGIPYATPPVGDLRWTPPQPVRPWKGIRKAQEFGSIAPQTLMPISFLNQIPQPQSEDCLFVNIWTPGLDDKKRAVMVWIHGGAFTIGSGSEPMYDSDKLVRRGDVVLVTINYRLGMLGFLRLKDITGGKIPGTGNEGLMDQVAALKWIKENIAAFGGDPQNVTVFGESAGGMSIGCLIAMPSAKGLFQKGILESGVGSTAVSLTYGNETGEFFLKTAGIKPDDVNALRALTPNQLLDIEKEMMSASLAEGGNARITVTTPVIDGEIIPDVPNEMAKKGYAKNIATIIGTNLEEWKLFAMMSPGFDKIDEAGMLKQLEAFVPAESAAKVVAAYRQAREKRGQPATPSAILSAIQTDLMFRMPALDLIQAQQANQAKAYNYLFTWKSPAMNGALGACHALEIGFVFGEYDALFCGTGPDADKLADCMQKAWLAFAKTGDPSNECTGKWPVYGQKRNTMIFNKHTRVETAPYDEERAIWENVKRRMDIIP
jgi:para-nitrobenzyl esterase